MGSSGTLRYLKKTWDKSKCTYSPLHAWINFSKNYNINGVNNTKQCVPYTTWLYSNQIYKKVVQLCNIYLFKCSKNHNLPTISIAWSKFTGLVIKYLELAISKKKIIKNSSLEYMIILFR